MIEVHLYGKLRRFAMNSAVSGDSILELDPTNVGCLADVLSAIGIQPQETSNIFVNGRLSSLTRRVENGDRVGVFPDDMALLYKWYFQKTE